MSKVSNHSHKSGETAAEQKGKHEVLIMINWFLDSVIYDLITWIAIAFSVGLTLVYLFAVSPRNWRGVFWSLILLAFCATIMIAVRVDQQFFRSKNSSPKTDDTAKPNIVFGDTRLREPLMFGKKPWVDIVLNNTSDIPAEGKFSDVTWRILVAPTNHQLEYAYQGLSLDFDLAAHQLRAIHFDITYQFAKEDIDALNEGRAFLYLYAKGEYWAENHPDTKRSLPFCLTYNKDVPGLLAVCSKNTKISEGRPGNMRSDQIVYPNPTAAISGAKLSEPIVVGKKPHTLVYFVNISSKRTRVTVEDQSVLYAPNTFKGPLKYQAMHNEPAEFDLNPTIPYTLDTVWDIVITGAMAKEMESDNATIYFYFRVVSNGESVPYCFRYNKAMLPDLPVCPASMKVEK